MQAACTTFHSLAQIQLSRLKKIFFVHSPQEEWVQIDGQVYEVLGEHRNPRGDCHYCLKHVASGEKFDVWDEDFVAYLEPHGDWKKVLSDLLVLALAISEEDSSDTP